MSEKAEKKERFAWGHKIPLPLGFSSPEALYPKIDLNLSKGPFLGTSYAQPRPRPGAPAGGCVVHPGGLKSLPCLELQPSLSSHSRLENSLRGFPCPLE